MKIEKLQMIETFYKKTTKQSPLLNLLMHEFCEFLNSSSEDYDEIIEQTLTSIFDNIEEMNEACDEKKKGRKWGSWAILQGFEISLLRFCSLLSF